jgi:hypothetical protein
LSNQDVLNYFHVQGEKGTIQRYAGNPDLTMGKDYSSITLDDLGINIDLIKNELMGMNNDLVDPVTGKPYPDDFYNQILERAVAEAEKIFDVAILPRVQVDRMDYHREDFNAFAYLQTNYRPILQVNDLTLYYNNQTILSVPDEWLKVTNRTGQIQVSPSVLMQGLNTTINPTIYPIINSPYGMTPSPYQETEFAPQMLGVTYVTGMMPRTGRAGINYDWMIQPDMLGYIAKLAAIEILERYGRSILGPGIASYSVHVDGIGTNVDTTQSPEFAATSGEIRNLQDDMKSIEQRLRKFYGDPSTTLWG